MNILNDTVETGEENDYETADNPDITGRHWVQDLFPPAFGYTLQEIIEGRGLLSEEDERRKTSAKEENDVFSQLSKVIPPADVAAIKNVYHRVWIMMRIKEKAALNNNENTKKVAPITDSVEANRMTGDTTSESTEPPKCIWTPSEIDMLRTEFRSTKNTNKSLQAQVKVLKEELHRAKTTENSQRKSARTQAEELHEAQNSNIRLQILCQNLKSEFDRSERVIAALRSDNAELRSNLEQMIKRYENVRKKLSIKQIEHDNLKLDIAEEKKNAVILSAKFDEKLQREINAKVQDTNVQLAALSAELENEKMKHRITHKGLEHLRMHFSGSQMTGGQNIVSKDQLNGWTYN